MLRLIMLFVLMAGTAVAQQTGSAVNAKESPPPGAAKPSSAPSSAAAAGPAPATSAQPATAAQPAPAQSTAEKTTENETAKRPTETPKGNRSGGRVAAFWIIIPGK